MHIKKKKNNSLVYEAWLKTKSDRSRHSSTRIANRSRINIRPGQKAV